MGLSFHRRLRVKLLLIVDVVASNFWLVKNELYISRQDETFFHSFLVYLPRARRERDCSSPCRPAGRTKDAGESLSSR